MKVVKLEKVAGKTVRLENGRRLILAKAPEGFPFDRLNALQTVFFRTYEGGRALVVAPTSSGKTGVGMLFMRGRGTYAVPTKSLAVEIYRGFKEAWGDERVGLKIGDVFDEYDDGEKDVYVATYESLANAFRTSKGWVSAPVVLDEVHHIYKERGVVIEEILAYLETRGWDYLTLSATVPDPEGLAKTVRADYLLVSEYRPVPIHKRYERVSGRGDEVLAEALFKALLSVPQEDTVLLFVYKKDIGYKLLRRLSDEGYGVMNETLPFIPERRGRDVAFHNADVPLKEREEIERAFRKGELKWLVATQTLAYGVNLPADRVLILVKKIKDRRTGRTRFLPDTLDVLQMEGRAGRYGIKEVGYVNVLVVTRSKNPLEEMLEELSEKRPYVEELSHHGVSLEEYWGISSHVALMILGAVASSADWREFLRSVPSLQGVDVSFLEEVYAHLERGGFISDNGLTPLGEVMLKSSISPIAYQEFKRRVSEGVEANLAVRPLMYMKRIKGSVKGFIPSDDYYGEVSAFKSKYYETLTLNDGTDELWMFVSGRLYEYPNVSNPPGELSFTRADLFHLARVLFTLHSEGYIFTTLEGVLRVLHSYRYGIPYEYAPLGGIEGIGFVRANALYRAVEMTSSHLVPFGDYVFPPEIKGLLEEVFHERYNDAERAKREAERTYRIVKGKRFLCDPTILEGVAFAVLRRDALKVLKLPPEEVMEVLRERFQT